MCNLNETKSEDQIKAYLFLFFFLNILLKWRRDSTEINTQFKMAMSVTIATGDALSSIIFCAFF